MGTTYAYLVTRAHNGQAAVESDADTGTTVTVRLQTVPQITVVI